MKGNVFIARFLLFIFTYQLLLPTSLHALTGGPSQPEVEGFAQVTASDLVDPFTGDVSYNIPLFEIGGYPINIVYNGGSSQDSEASWVGFGWTLNPGVINREVRGVPDDFNGESIKREFNIRPNITVGAGVNVSGEFAGFDKAKFSGSLTLSYNNYQGFSISKGINVAANINKSLEDESGFGGSLGISTGPGGVDISAGLSFTKSATEYKTIGITGGMNSREGLKDISISRTINEKVKKTIKRSDGGPPEVDRKGKVLESKGGSISFGYTPSMPAAFYPIVSSSLTARITGGGAVKFLHPNYGLRAFYSEQRLSRKVIEEESYGSLYLQNGSKGDVLDYVKEKNIPLNKFTTKLSPVYMASDIFNVMAQQVGGQFRIKRSEIGTFRKPLNTSFSNGTNVGFEGGGGDLVHLGVDINVALTFNTTTQWHTKSSTPFKNYNNSNREFQPAYFYNTQQLSCLPFNLSESSAISAVKHSNNKVLSMLLPDGKFSDNRTADDFMQQKRIPTNTLMTYLDASQADQFALIKNIQSYPENILVFGSINKSLIKNYSRLEHPMDQISEITITGDQGIRYIFGIPAYNVKKREVTFNAKDGLDHDLNTILYTPQDASVENKNGRDYFFEATETPPYAHSYLLTAVASPDYVDVNGDGLTDDDIGNLVKFNYSKAYGNFKWRTPHLEANNNPGFKVLDNDTKGSYIYGEKEIWYTHSIESKNQIALFYTSANRTDGLESGGEHGGNGSNRIKRLDSIQVFSKSDIAAHSSSAVPIKTIIFEYSQELFKGLLNGDGEPGNNGKLTLKKVYFTYGKNRKGKLNGYSFTYYEDDGYNERYNDRWGNYKPEHNGGLSNRDFPYAEQNPERANENARAGQLKTITLPSKAVIEIEYESDTYAYVMDKPAGIMYPILGFDNNDNPQSLPTTRTKLHQIAPLSITPNNTMYLELQQPVSNREDFFNQYLSGLGDNIYFDCSLDLNNSEEFFDRVKGYCKIQNYGVFQDGTRTIGWIRIKNLSGEDSKINPIAFAGLQTLRLELPDLAYPGGYLDFENMNPVNAANFLKQQFLDIKELFLNFNKNSVRQHKKCNTIDITKSWIRLKDPDRTKYGGGHRVSKVTIKDDSEVGYSTIEYGQEYDYDIELPDSRGTYSSGVASYDPMVGIEEFLGKVPTSIEEKVALAPNKFYYIEDPLGEQLYPSASVGYSHVKITPFGNNSSKNTGFSVNRYYTAYDYPSYTLSTKIDVADYLRNPLKFFNIDLPTFFTAIQGHSIVVNDMHGKPRSVESFDKAGSLINKTEYFYKNQSGTIKPTPSNIVQTVDQNSNIQSSVIGVDIDIFQELNQNNSMTTTPGVMINYELTTLAVPPVLAFASALPLFSVVNQNTRTAVVTKYIKKAGILDKTVTTTANGSVVITENLLYDKETCRPVLTSVNNGYNDKYFNIQIPAYWGYSQMGLASRNSGLYALDVALEDGIIPSGIGNLFVEGDELQVFNSLNPTLFKPLPAKYYVLTKNNSKYICNANGVPLGDGNFAIKILRSGNRNFFGSDVATIVTYEYPIKNNRLELEDLDRVLAATAIEYNDYNKIECGKVFQKQCNPVDLQQMCLYTGGGLDIWEGEGELQQNYWDPSSSGYDHWNSDIGGPSPAQPRTYLINPSTTCEANNKIGALLTDAVIHYLNYGFGDTPITSTNELLSFFESHSNMSISESDRTFITTNFPLEYLPVSGLFPGLSVQFGNCKIRILNNGRASSLFKANLAANNYLHVRQKNSSNQDLVDVSKGTYLGEDFARYHSSDGITNIYYDIGVIFNGRFVKISTAEFSCVSCNDGECVENPDILDQPVNPYAKGLKGTWRPYRSYTYLEERDRNMSTSTTNIRQEGQFLTWSPFWNFSSSNGNKLEKVADESKWKWDAQVTLRDKNGNDVEQRDPLYRYSSALFTYNRTLNSAVASNARYQQIANDHFEDYQFDTDADASEPCFDDHWSFRNVLAQQNTVELSTDQAHTGLHSLKLPSESNIILSRNINNDAYNDEITRNENGVYKLDNGDCIKKFSPLEGRYVISAWVKSTVACKEGLGIQAPVIVSFGEGSTPVEFFPSGPIIEGWQRIYGYFDVSSSDQVIEVKLSNEENQTVFFDDIRIHPFKSNMKAFVYDPFTLRLHATLDENNYATFYEYDSEGKLIRVKRETERGIVTLKEHRQELIKGL